MRIIHLTAPLVNIGNGVANASIDLSVAQARAAHEVAIAAADGDYRDLITTEGIRYIPLSMEYGSTQLVVVARRLARVLRELRPDIVHAHTVRAALAGRLALLLTGSRARLVCTAHNGFTARSFPLALADELVCVSSSDALSVRKRHLKASTVLNGPLGTARPVRSAAGRKPSLKKPAIVQVGGLYRRKGVLTLVSALTLIERHEPVHLYFVGGGPDKEVLEQFIRVKGVEDRVHLCGFSSTPMDYFEQADIVALASLAEAFGLVLAEARQAGCAIVASRVGGIPEVLEHGAAGLLVEPGDPASWAQALNTMLESPDVADGYRRRAAQGLDWLTIERVERDYAKIYSHALRNRVQSAS